MDIAIGVLVAVVVIVLVFGIASMYFYYKAIHRADKSSLFGSPDPNLAELIERDSEANQAWLSEHVLEEVQIQSEDGLTLYGHYLKSAKETQQTAIIVHGYSCKGLDMISYARIYSNMLGMNILLPDNRGHGRSEGHYMGFGWHDRKDIQGWISYILERNGNDTEIVLHGVSMGAATVLMVSGEKLPANVKVIIADCAYSSLEAQLKHQMRQMYKLPSFPLLQTTSWVCRLRAGYSFKEPNTLRQVQSAQAPILFIHGDADTFVPTEMVYPLYEQCASEKELWIVPAAAHAKSVLIDYEGYAHKVIHFIQRFMHAKTAADS